MNGFTCIKYKLFIGILIYFFVVNCFSNDNLNENINCIFPEKLSIFYNKIKAYGKYNFILGDFNSSVSAYKDSVSLHSAKISYNSTQIINTSLFANKIIGSEFIAPFNLKRNDQTKSAIISVINIAYKDIELKNNRKEDLGGVVFGDIIQKYSTSNNIIIEQGININNNIICTNKNSITSFIDDFYTNYQGVLYRLDKRKEYAEFLKAYSCLMFYDRVQANITIDRNSKLLGNYAIASSAAFFTDATDTIINNPLFSGSIYNYGHIIGHKASINLANSAVVEGSKVNISINNSGSITGSIILSLNQTGTVDNSGDILKNKNYKTVISLGDIKKLYNRTGALIEADTLDVASMFNNGIDFQLVNYAGGSLKIDNLIIANIINEDNAEITAKNFKITQSNAHNVNNGVITANTIELRNLFNGTTGKITAKAQLVIDSNVTNLGKIFADKTTINTFNNHTEFYTNSLQGKKFINKKTGILAKKTSYLPFYSTAKIENNGIINIENNCNINNDMINNASFSTDILKISQGIINNFSVIEIKKGIRCDNGYLSNNKNAIIRCYAQNLYLDGKNFFFRNAGVFEILHKLTVTSDFSNSSQCIINTLSSMSQAYNSAVFINEDNAICEVNTLDNAQIHNKKTAELYIKNIKGNSYIDYYLPYEASIIDKNAILTIGIADLHFERNQLTNNGTFIITDKISINNNTLINNGTIDIRGDLEVATKLENLGTIKFNKSINNNKLTIINNGVIDFLQTATIKKYKGNKDSSLKLKLLAGKVDALLVADEIAFFEQNTNSNMSLLIDADVIDKKQNYNLILLAANHIKFPTNSSIENLKIYIKNNNINYDDANSSVLAKDNLLLTLTNVQLINKNNKQCLSVDLKSNFVTKYFFPTVYSNGYYSNEDAIHGVINTDISKVIKIDDYKSGVLWHVKDNSLYIGENNAGNSAKINSNASAKHKAMLSLDILQSNVAIDAINFVTEINASNQNNIDKHAVYINTKIKNIATNHALWLSKGLIIQSAAKLIASGTNGAALQIDYPLEGDINNYGLLQGTGFGININANNAYIHGNIVNHGIITAKNAIVATVKNILSSSTISNHNTIKGNIHIIGDNVALVNNAVIDSFNSEILFEKAKIATLVNSLSGLLTINKISAVNGALVKINNHGSMTLKEMLVDECNNYNKMYINNNFTLPKKFINYNNSLLKVIGSVSIDNQIENHGSIIATTKMNINTNLVNHGYLTAATIEINQDLTLVNAKIITNNITTAGTNNINIYGAGDVLVANITAATLVNNIILHDATLCINNNVTQVKNKLLVHDIAIENPSFIRRGSLPYLSISSNTEVNITTAIDSKLLKQQSLVFYNAGTLSLASYSNINSLVAMDNSTIILDLPDFERESSNNNPLLSIDILGNVGKDLKIYLRPNGKISNKMHAVDLMYTKNGDIKYNAHTITANDLKNLFPSTIIDGITVKLQNIILHTGAKKISARLKFIDSGIPGVNSNKAYPIFADSLAYSTINNFDSLAWKYNTVVANNTNTVSSNNLIMYPYYFARDSRYVNFDGKKLTIKPQKNITEYADVLSVIIISNSIKADSNFHKSPSDTLAVKRIEIDNIILDGRHKKVKSQLLPADNNGLVFTGINDYKVNNDIYFGKHCKILASNFQSAVQFDCFMHVNKIINDGVIGDENTGYGIYINNFINGEIINNNHITGKQAAILIKTATDTKDIKRLSIYNNATINGSIYLLYIDKKNKYIVSINNNGLIDEATIVINGMNSLFIHNNQHGIINAKNNLSLSTANFTNKGILNANKINLASDLTVDGTITAKYLTGLTNKLVAKNLIVDTLADIDIKADYLQINQNIEGKVTIDGTLTVANEINNNSNLKLAKLVFNDKGKINNNGAVFIEADNSIRLSDKTYTGTGKLECQGDIELSGDFTVNSLVTTKNIHLHNYKFNIASGGKLIVNNINAIDRKKPIILANKAVLQVGHDIGIILDIELVNNNQQSSVNKNTKTQPAVKKNITSATITGNLYVQDKAIANDANINVNVDVLNIQGILKLGSFKTTKKTTINILTKSSIQLTNEIIDNNLNIINQGLLTLPSYANFNYYNSKDATTVLYIDRNKQSTLKIEDKIVFSFDSLIQLKLSSISKDKGHFQFTLIDAPKDKILCNLNNQEITLSNNIANRMINNNYFIYDDFIVHNIKLENNNNRSKLLADILLKKTEDKSSSQMYVGEGLSSNLTGDCITEDFITDSVVLQQDSSEVMHMTNFIVAPAAVIQEGNYIINYSGNNLVIGNSKNKNILQAANNIPALVLGINKTQQNFQLESTEKNYNLYSLEVATIKLNNLTIKGCNNNTDSIQDAFVIIGKYPLKIQNGLFIEKNCLITSGSEHHAVHLAASIEGDFINRGVIGDENTSIGLAITQLFDGSITNKNIIQGKDVAIDVNLKHAYQNNKDTQIVNEGTILGSILFTKSILINSRLNLHNKKNATINANSINVNNIYNSGNIVSQLMQYNNLVNYGNIKITSNKIFSLNTKTDNKGIMAIGIAEAQDFTNNGKLFINELRGTSIVNNGNLIINNISANKTTDIIQNKGVLTIQHPLALDIIFNEGTLIVNNAVKLNRNYNNLGALILDKLTCNNCSINNKQGSIACDLIENVNIKDGLVVVKQEISATNNVSNLQVNNKVKQTGTLVAQNILGTGRLDIYGTIRAQDISVKQIFNYDTLNVANDLKVAKNDSISHIHNEGAITAKKIANYTIDNQNSITTYELQNITCTNTGNLTIKQKISGDNIIYGKLELDNVSQSGKLTVDRLYADNMTVDGHIIVTGQATVNNFTNNNYFFTNDIVIKGTQAINKAKIIAKHMIINGKLTNKKNASININGDQGIALSNNNIDNLGIISANKLTLSGDFNNQGALIIEEEYVSHNFRLHNAGSFIFNSKREFYLDDKFINSGIAKINNILLQSNFDNYGIISAQEIDGNSLGKIVFYNHERGKVTTSYIRDIKIKNKGKFIISSNISGSVFCDGAITLANDILQNAANFVVDSIQADEPINLTINKGVTVFNNPVADHNINIINHASVLHIKANTYINHYESHGGLINIWLPSNLEDNKKPLLTLKTAKFYNSENESLIIVNAVPAEKTDIYSVFKKVTILSANNILYNNVNLDKNNVLNLLAIQKNTNSGFIKNIKSTSLLLKIDSPEIIVDDKNKINIIANISWYDVADLSSLTDNPYNLSLLKKLYKDTLGSESMSLIKKVKNMIYNGNMSESALPIVEYLLDVVENKKFNIGDTILKGMYRKNFIDLLSSSLPDNSMGSVLATMSFSDSVFDDISKRLSMDRISVADSKSKPYHMPSKKKGYWGVNSGSSYLDTCIWSSLSINKYIESINNKYSSNTWTTQIASFGIDDKFNVIKIGIMFSYASSLIHNKAINKTNSYTSSLKSTLNSMYLNYSLDKSSLNFMFTYAQTKHSQNYLSLLSLSTENKQNYTTTNLGFVSEYVYPIFFKNSKLEIAEVLKFNRVLIPRYSPRDLEIRASQAINVIELGVLVNFNHKLVLNYNTNVNLLCSVAGLYSFSNTHNRIKVDYFNKKFFIAQRTLNSFNISLDLAATINIKKRFNVNFDISMGRKINSKFIAGNLSFNYSF